MLAHREVDPVSWLRQYLEKRLICAVYKSVGREVRQLEL